MPQAVAPAQASKGRDNERKQTHRDDSHTLLQRGGVAADAVRRLTTLSENAQLAPDDDDRIDYRFLFVDDGSKDSTRDEIREFASNRQPT